MTAPWFSSISSVVDRLAYLINGEPHCKGFTHLVRPHNAAHVDCEHPARVKIGCLVWLSWWRFYYGFRMRLV
jgi:hypothetical protein